MAREFDAVSLDVGGVLVVPDHGALAGALDRLEVRYDRTRFGIGHYEAMAAVEVWDGEHLRPAFGAKPVRPSQVLSS